MALAQNLTLGWIWQGKALAPATGFVMMTRAELDAAIAEGRAQDPRVGALRLKFITRELWTAPDPPEVEPSARRGRRSAPPPPPAPEADAAGQA